MSKEYVDKLQKAMSDYVRASSRRYRREHGILKWLRAKYKIHRGMDI